MRSFVFIAICWLVVGCGTGAATPPPSVPPPSLPPTVMPTPIPPTATPKPNEPFRIVGYVTDWDAVVSQKQIEKLTHINYAFALPKADGTIDFPANEWKLQQIVQLAHAKNIKVLISVGGWGLDKQFEAFAASADKRAIFISSVMHYVDKNQLDGVDIDWEYPIPGASSENFRALMQELRVQVDAHKGLLTAAVAAYGDNAEGIPADVFPLTDFVNVMAYADEGPHHSPYELATRALDYWQGRGLVQDKTVLGVPFYGMPGDVPYSKIVRYDADAPQNEFSKYLGGNVGYNGLPTMRAKTKLAMERANGVMVWTINDDTLDKTSLLSAIQETVQGK